MVGVAAAVAKPAGAGEPHAAGSVGAAGQAISIVCMMGIASLGSQ
jgi:hypothetical protein